MSLGRSSPVAQIGVASRRRSVLDAPARVEEPLFRRKVVVADRAFRSSARKRLLGRIVLYGGTLAVVAILLKRLPWAGPVSMPGGSGAQEMADPGSVLLQDPLILLALGMTIALAHLGKWLVERAAAEAGDAGAARTDIGNPPRPAKGSWSASFASGRAWWQATVEEVEAVRATVRRKGVWGFREKLVPYLTAIVTYFSVLLTLMALSKTGLESGLGITARIGIIVPAIVFGLVLAGALLPAILVLDRVAARLGIARGVSDVSIGLILNSPFLYPVVSRVSEGMMPKADMVLPATPFLIAGAVAGFVFWRGEGYPQRVGYATAPDL